MLSTGVQAIFGFFFWIVCARLYIPGDVGIATSLIAAASLMTGFGLLGFNNVIIRFLPTSERKNEHLSTAFILSGVASIIAGVAFLVWAVLTHSPSVQYPHFILLAVIFIVYVSILTLNSVVGSAFIAYRAAHYVLWENIVFSILKLSLVFMIIGIGFMGILSATTVATVIACCLGFFWLFKEFHYRPTWKLDKTIIVETRRFAASNYIGSLFGILPSSILTLIVLSRLGSQEAAFFYMPSMIVAFLNIIPSSTAQSLFAEISHDESRLVKYLKDGLKNLFLLLVPAIIVTWFLGGFILRFFGANYASAGTWPLRILALASLIGAANYFGDTLLNIKKLAGLYIFMNALNALSIVVLAYIMVPYGLMAVAWSVLIGQVITVIAYFIINWRTLIDLRKVPA